MRRISFAILSTLTLSLLATSLEAQTLDYPLTRKVDHTDTYFGTKVSDPYRWLEDDNALETAEWVAAQNKLTFGYLERLPYRAAVLNRLKALTNYPKYSLPFKKNENVFFYKNDGLQNQSILYIQKGFDGVPEVLIDPNTFSTDGTVRLTAFSLSKNGRYAAYGKTAIPGSDWQAYYVMDMSTHKTLPEVLHWIKFSGASWRGDGFYYSRYPTPEKGMELKVRAANQKVYYHRVGTPQSEDTLVYEDPSHPDYFLGVNTTEDERFTALYVTDPNKRGNTLHVRDDSKHETRFKQIAPEVKRERGRFEFIPTHEISFPGNRTPKHGQFETIVAANTVKRPPTLRDRNEGIRGTGLSPIVQEISEDSFSLIDNDGDTLLIATNKGAPNTKIVRVDPKHPEEYNWKTILPEKSEPMSGISAAGGKLFATYLKDVASRVTVYSRKGRLENEIALSGPGTANGFSGEKEDKEVFYSFESLNYPRTSYRYNIQTRKTTLFQAPEIPGFKATDYESKEVFYTSKDGTRIPMFLVYKKGLKRDGRNPTLLTGYGGFNITINPNFSATNIAWLEQGGIFAQANLRGGAEYGEKWHEAGIKLKKQNVFDDCIAAAEFLIRQKYTSRDRLALEGASNGGLLVGAVINQRPDLFKVAIPEVGVMDMLRFQKFSAGVFWVSDYGSSDDEAQFKYLLGYSPLQNIKPGVKYPATMVTTANHDDRVVPAHSFKYAATLQENQVKSGGTAPILIRIETNSGHGSSNLSKALEAEADVYSFIWANMGITPKY